MLKNGTILFLMGRMVTLIYEHIKYTTNIFILTYHLFVLVVFKIVRLNRIVVNIRNIQTK